MKKVIIIGNGPAGIAASLYTQRANIQTIIIGKDYGALSKADKIENYYGFQQPIGGKELIENGINQATRLGTTFIQDEVTGLSYDKKFIVKTVNQNYEADAVLLATGSSRTNSIIKGATTFEGKGVSYCATCDAFFYKNKDVAVIGNGEYALKEAIELSHVAKSVTILTNGLPIQFQLNSDIPVIELPLKEIKGNEVVSSISFVDDSELFTSGVFIALGVANTNTLAIQLGALVENKKIHVDDTMSTTFPGLYAAGDCTGGMLQISKAVYEGSKAGSSMIHYVRNLPELS